MSFIKSIKNCFHKMFSGSNKSDNTSTQSSDVKPESIVCYPDGSVKPLSQAVSSDSDSSKKSA